MHVVIIVGYAARTETPVDELNFTITLTNLVTGDDIRKITVSYNIHCLLPIK